MERATLILALACTACSGTPFFNHHAPDDCRSSTEETARIFYVDVPDTASANATCSVVPWFYLTGGASKLDEIKTATASVDIQNKTIRISGTINRYHYKPDDKCPRVTLGIAPTAATCSIPVSAPPGTYTVKIEDLCFTISKPERIGYGNEPIYPEAMATRSLTIQ